MAFTGYMLRVFRAALTITERLGNRYTVLLHSCISLINSRNSRTCTKQLTVNETKRCYNWKVDHCIHLFTALNYLTKLKPNQKIEKINHKLAYRNINSFTHSTDSN